VVIYFILIRHLGNTVNAIKKFNQRVYNEMYKECQVNMDTLVAEFSNEIPACCRR